MKRRASKRSYDHMASAKLAQAVRDDDAPAARRALAAGANPNLRGPQGALNQTSLVDKAVESGSHAALHVLLEAGARVVPPKQGAVTLAFAGTAIHAAARVLDLKAMRLFEKHRKAGPMEPLDENFCPPLAHALRGASHRLNSRPNPAAEASELMAHWLSSPLALKEKGAGQATFNVLDAAIGTQPVAFLDRLLAAGLDFTVTTRRFDPNPFVNAITRWAGQGVSAEHAETVRQSVEDWTVALARLGFPWPEDQGERPEGAALKAVYDAARYAQALDESRADAPASRRRRRL